MAFLFEAAFSKDWDNFERVYDTELKRTVVRQIYTKPEYFVQSAPTNPRAHYKFILDSDKVFEKCNTPKKGMRQEYGFQDSINNHIRDYYWARNESDTKYNLNARYWCVDIESRSGVVEPGFPVPHKALEEITMFQIYDSELETLILLGTKDWKDKEQYIEKFHEKYTGSEAVKGVKFMNCKDELNLIKTYFHLFKQMDPLIIYAWNGLGFDYPYIYNRLKNLGLDPNVMSNHGIVKYTEDEFQGRIQFKFKVDGHFYIDMMDVYKKFTFHPMPNYSLDTVAEFELKENKVSHSEYERFDDFYTGNYTIPQNPTEEQLNSPIYKAAIEGRTQDVKDLSYGLFCYYGLIDTYLIERLIRKLKFHSILLMISSKMGVQVSDSMATVKPWSQFVSNVAMMDNIIMPPSEEHDQPYIVGGFVRAPLNGIIKWAVSEDVTSMYPLLSMVAFNMSPETYVPKHKLPDDIRDVIMKYYPDQNEENRFDIPKEVKDYLKIKLKAHKLSLAINGACFSTKKVGIIPQLIMEIYTGRKADKGISGDFAKIAIQMKDYLKHH